MKESAKLRFQVLTTSIKLISEGPVVVHYWISYAVNTHNFEE
jgi:hypothetical protein